MGIESLLALGLGLLIGSFLNVCIHRLPLNEPIAVSRSKCPSCGKLIRWWDNVPVLSFLLLKGKCRDCGEKISWRYPLVELVNGLGYFFLVWRFGAGVPAAVYAVFFSGLVVVTVIDFYHQIIPNAITLPGMVLGLAVSGFLIPTGLVNAVLGLLLGGGLFYAVAVLSRGGMGGGDIKLIAMIGSFLGWKSTLLTILSGALAGSVVGLFLMAFRGKDRKFPVPFGPFLSMGAVIALFGGPAIWDWYMHWAVLD